MFFITKTIQKPFKTSKKDYNNLLKIWSLKAGIKGKNVTSHVARHTFAISNLQKGVSLYHVSKLIAHDSIRTTERLYGKFAMEDLDKALAIAFE